MRLSLRQKVALLVVGLVLGLMSAVLLVANLSITASIEGRIRKDLQAAQKVFEQFEVLRSAQLLAQTRMVSELPQIKAMVTTKEIGLETLLDSARSAQRLIDSDLLMLTDDRGRLLASSTEPKRQDSDLSSDPAIASALRGEAFVAVRDTGQGLYQIVAVPFVFSGVVVGALFTGFAVDRAMLETLETMTNCHVALIHGSSVETSAVQGHLFDKLRGELQAAGGAPVGPVVTRALGDERYLLISGFFGKGPTRYVLARSLDAELVFYRELQRELLLVALGILAVGLVGGTLYARRITRPILALAAEARRVARGDLEPRDLVTSSDEIGELGAAFQKMTSELRRSRDELLSSEQQLRQAQKMEAVGRLAGGVAHDFNNLLTAILGHNELMLLGLDEGDSRRRHHVDQIIKTSNRAAALVQQLLAFSRRQTLQPRVLDLGAVVADTQAMLQRLIGADVELVTQMARPLGRVLADPNQIEQVILNLAVNARDAMPRGGRLSIEAYDAVLDEAQARQRLGAKSGWYTVLAVSDTGIGMNPETLSHIFEPFFTTKEDDKGTGLGLSTVYGIVEQSGGHMQVWSERGRGARFEIYLPQVDEPLPVVAEIPALSVSPKGWETILLVEDEPEVRELATEILRRRGYTVLPAKHGGEAFELCQKHTGPIHLLLTDVVMPVEGGMALATRLAPLRPEMRVLYMSGYTEDTVLHHGIPVEEVAFLQKPFTGSVLSRKVREILDAK